MTALRRNAGGNIAFKPIKYTLDDVGAHEYTVREESKDGNGIITDKTVYTVTVDVSDNGDGTLKTAKSENADALDFVNVYEENGEIEFAFSGTKFMEGRELTDKDVFRFLIEENGEVIASGDDYEALDFTNTSKDKSAGTGDTFPLLYAMMLMALSGIVIILLLGRRRKA